MAALSLVRAPDASAAATPALPFDLVAAPSTRLVLAHYVPWFPVSFDNVAASGDTYARAYLDPAGEGGKHAAYGGFLRDRPQPRPVSADPAWRDADMRQEVRDAISAGIDGFAVDIPSVSPTARSWAAVVRLLRAAHDVDPSFRVLLQPDMVGLARFDSATIAAALATLADQPAAMRYDDGRLLVSPYFAEKRTVAWWTDWLGSMSLDHGIDVALFPVLQNDLVWGDDFAPISVGIGNWGSRNPSWNSPTSTGATSPRGRIAAAHARGNLWMQPVSVQDERPRAGLFDEAANTQNLRDTWKVARDGGADWVLLPTWNDYAEGTAIAPSLRHGRAFLDLMAYYTAWFKSGRAPQIVRDGVYLTHRTQQAGAAPVFAQSKLMVLRGGTQARDTVEALAFLTAPAVVTVTVGGTATSCALPAGVSPCVAPLRPGSVSADVTRSGARRGVGGVAVRGDCDALRPGLAVRRRQQPAQRHRAAGCRRVVGTLADPTRTADTEGVVDGVASSRCALGIRPVAVVRVDGRSRDGDARRAGGVVHDRVALRGVGHAGCPRFLRSARRWSQSLGVRRSPPRRVQHGNRAALGWPPHRDRDLRAGGSLPEGPVGLRSVRADGALIARRATRARLEEWS